MPNYNNYSKDLGRKKKEPKAKKKTTSDDMPGNGLAKKAAVALENRKKMLRDI